MGADKEPGRVKHSRLQIGVAALQGSRALALKRTTFLLGCAAIVGACSIVQQTPDATQIQPLIRATLEPTATGTPAATASPTPSPTYTPSPKPTSTPLPQVTFSSQPAASHYQVPPTVQMLTPFEALIHFELDRPSPGWLFYRTEGKESPGWWAVPLDEAQTQHEIPLVGLSPGSPYAVQVGLGEAFGSVSTPRLFGAVWGPIRFDAPALGEPDLRFGVVGDSGFGDDRTAELINRMSEHDLDFVLLTGDVVYNAHEESGPAEAFARKYYKMFAPLLHANPVFPVPGNHEYDRAARFDGRPYFVHAFPALTDPSVPKGALGTWYAFERSGVQFIMLDSHAFHGAGGRAEQTAWLQQRLMDPAFRFSIPVFHVPPYTSGLHRNDGAALRQEWIPLFEQAGVPLALSGHDHNYERIERNGVTYLVSGGGSAITYGFTQQVDGSQAFHRRTHFVIVEVSLDTVSLTAIDFEGKLLEQATIPLAPP